MAGTATEYIQHHLTHLNNIGAKQGSIVDFSVFNFDTAVFSILMMLLAVWLMYSAAKKAYKEKGTLLDYDISSELYVSGELLKTSDNEGKYN
mgnify:CR=1 FL=1